MKYDLSNKTDRKRFTKRANFLLRKQRKIVSLVDESDRTPNQNKYLHVLCRIMAMETGTTERYAKQVYLKDMANRDIFFTATKDPLTNEMMSVIRSTADLSITEMSIVISKFIKWAAEQGISLPKARIKEDGSLEFESKEDEIAYHQAEIETSKLNEYL